jgi:hypothetical protein
MSKHICEEPCLEYKAVIHGYGVLDSKRANNKKRICNLEKALLNRKVHNIMDGLFKKLVKEKDPKLYDEIKDIVKSTFESSRYLHGKDLKFGDLPVNQMGFKMSPIPCENNQWLCPLHYYLHPDEKCTCEEEKKKAAKK